MDRISQFVKGEDSMPRPEMDAAAMELFMSKKKKARIAEAQKRRIESNVKAAEVFKAWNNGVKKIVADDINTVIRAVRPIFTQHIKAPYGYTEEQSLSEILTKIFDQGYCYEETYIMSGEYEYENEERDSDGKHPWDVYYENAAACRDKVNAALSKLKLKCDFIKLHCTFDDDDPDSSEIVLWVEFYNHAQEKIVKMGAPKGSIDSFLSYYVADEGYGKGIFTAATGAAWCLTMIPGLIVTKHPFWAFWAGVVGLSIIGDGVNEISRTKDRNIEWNNLTPEEEASLKVFATKYEPMMRKACAELQKAFMAIPEGDRFGFMLRPASPNKFFKRHLFTHFFMPAIEVTYLDTRSKTGINTAEIAANTRDAFGKKIEAISDELEDKTKGILRLNRIYSGGSDYVGVSFNYVGRDGVILPNLE